MNFDLTHEPYHQLITLYNFFIKEMYVPKATKQRINIKIIINKLKSDFLLYKSFIVFLNYVIDDILNVNTLTEFLIYNVLYRTKIKNIHEINPLQFFIDEIFEHYNENLLHLYILKLESIYNSLMSIEFSMDNDSNIPNGCQINNDNQNYFFTNKKKETIN
jgi:hypothetical protein